MPQDRTPGRTAVRAAGNAGVPAPLAGGIKARAKSLFSIMAETAGGGRNGAGGGGGGGRRGRYSKTFEEEHSWKQPLLVKSRDGDFAAGRPTTFDFGQDNVRSDSWKVSQAAQQERYDAAEARGYGLYSLHAVIGQGTFGRIHLASWQHKGGGVDSTTTSSAAPPAAAASLSRSLSAGGSSLSARGGGDSGGGAGGRAAEGGRESCRPSSSSPGSASSMTATRWGQGSSSRSEASTPRGFCGTVGGAAAGGAGPRATGHHRISGSTGSVRSLFGSNGGEALQSLFSEDDGVDGEEGGEGGQLRLRALKSVCKRKVTEKGLARHMETELAVLKQCSHPFIVSLSPGGQFQTSRHLHLVLNYCPGGDLFSLLARVGRLPEPQVRVCAAQLALALRHLHSKHIAYRDLKPDNVCIDARGHAILVDFSLARTGLDEAPGGKAFTFCGSAAYAAPEIIAKRGHDTRVDLWSLGCVVFEALVGEHPFQKPRGRKTDRKALFERIQQGRLEYPPCLSAPALSLIKSLLSLNPDDRPGFSFPSAPSRKPAPEARPRPNHEERQRAMATATRTATTAPPSDSEWPFAPVPISAPPPTKMSSAMSSSSSCRGIPNDSERGRAGKGKVEGISRIAGRPGKGEPAVLLDPRRKAAGREEALSAPRSSAADQSTGGMLPAGVNAEPKSCASTREPPPLLLLEHRFFRGLPGWGGPGTGGAWDEALLEGLAVAVPTLRHPFDVRHFDSRFTSQAVELTLQGHPHKGGPTPTFEEFDWREDSCIEYAQVEERRAPGLFESLASALWC